MTTRSLLRADIVWHLGDGQRGHGGPGVVSLLLLVGLRRLVPRFPARSSSWCSASSSPGALDLAAHGVNIAGPVPAGLPDFAFPRIDGSDLVKLVGVAGGIFLVGFSDSILTARSFAARRGERIDGDQELLAFSAANVAAGVTQGCRSAPAVRAPA